MRPFPRNPNYGVTEDGRVFRIVAARFGKPVPHELTQTVGKKGYLYVGNGSGRGLMTIAVHRAVAETYIPNPSNLPEVAHQNGVKTHNVVSNLRWSTYADNQADRLLHGTHNRGSRQTNHKLDEAVVAQLRSGRAEPAAVASRYGAGVKHVREAARGKDWPHVSG